MGLIDAIRTGTVLDNRSRELAILRVAAVNRSAYERKQHVPRIALVDGRYARGVRRRRALAEEIGALSDQG